VSRRIKSCRIVDPPKRGDDDEHVEKRDSRPRRQHRGAGGGPFCWPRDGKVG